MIEVLSQIQEVLAEEDQEDEVTVSITPQDSNPAAKSPARMQGQGRRSSVGGGGGLHLPPEIGEVSTPFGSQVAAAVAGGGVGVAGTANNNAQKVESLRMDLEQALGSGKFLEAYRWVRLMYISIWVLFS